MWKSCEADPPDYYRKVILIYRMNTGLQASTAMRVQGGQNEGHWKLRSWPKGWFIPLIWAEVPPINEIRYEDTRI